MKEQDNNEFEDPEGVDLVGDQAEKSEEQEMEDYEDDPEYIDLDNIDPALLKQLERQALAGIQLKTNF
jgi:hypothetical protein